MSASEVTRMMQSIMAGRLDDGDIRDFLIDLHKEGETVEEITAAALVMREHALRFPVAFEGIVDTCGTGGDAKNTLNVSTISAIVAASAGAVVAKHGNRSISSSCGSADLLEMLGIKIDLSIEALVKLIRTTGFGFFFAPNFHPATRHAMAARKSIQGKTIFNLLGPLTNPAGAKFQVIGVYDVEWVEPMAQVLKALGSERALVVCGTDGMDEISICAPTQVAELQYGRIKKYEVKPEDFGIKPAPLSSLQVATKEQAKEAALKIFNGNSGPMSDIVLLNAGAALYVSDLAPTIKDGFSLARMSVRHGAALKKYDDIRKNSHL